MFIYLLASILVISSHKTTAFRICIIKYAEHMTFSDYSNQSNDYFTFRVFRDIFPYLKAIFVKITPIFPNMGTSASGLKQHIYITSAAQF